MFGSDDIRRAVDPGTLRHGREDLARRLVISVVRKESGRGAFAAVRDPGGKPHKCDLAWQPRPADGWSFNSQCSCRSGKLCRHAVAALLWLVQHESPEGDENPPPPKPPAVPLPPPAASGPAPRPGLRLLRLEPDSGPRGERVLDFAQLWFAYGGTRCSYDERSAPPARGEHESRREPPRDRAAERRAREQLQALGLFPSDPERPSLLLPRSERDWLSLMSGPIPALQDAGWIIEIDPDFSFRLYEAAPDFLARLDDAPGGDWFGLALDIEVDGERRPLLPLLIAVLRQQLFTPQRFAALDDATPIILHDEPRGRWIRMAAGRLKPIVASLLELFETPKRCAPPPRACATSAASWRCRRRRACARNCAATSRRA